MTLPNKHPPWNKGKLVGQKKPLQTVVSEKQAISQSLFA